ncbi:SHOCT domain-containing protein [Actinomadura rayongensis]|uniref:SHOCT domain-containing protein n=1 Tax=Actinomadura rayongensis TaxID=1429076 RepID=A0A6I4WAF5_9ACTN|nr:SHOCT domain-containing protein [Actinomadura rayongensis]MXQ66628.1 SHOCT domain-containing protein [Actinomadura rayongensis]
MFTTVLAHGPWNDSGGPHAFWPLFPLLWALVLGGGFVLVRRRMTARPATAQDPTRNARALLADRFARGEIDEDEYHARLAVLRYDA